MNARVNGTILLGAAALLGVLVSLTMDHAHGTHMPVRPADRMLRIGDATTHAMQGR